MITWKTKDGKPNRLFKYLDRRYYPDEATIDDLRECISQMSAEDRARLGIPVPTINACQVVKNLTEENRKLQSAFEGAFAECGESLQKIKNLTDENARLQNQLSETQRSLEASRVVVERQAREYT